jgi:hypothetical protein
MSKVTSPANWTQDYLKCFKPVDLQTDPSPRLLASLDDEHRFVVNAILFSNLAELVVVSGRVR